MGSKVEAYLSSCIRGHYVYNIIWTAIVGEELLCARGVGNAKNRYAISVLWGLYVVEHLSQKISRICSLFSSRWYNHLYRVEYPETRFYHKTWIYIITTTECKHKNKEHMVKTTYVVLSQQKESIQRWLMASNNFTNNVVTYSTCSSR